MDINILPPDVSVIDRRFCYPFAVNLFVVPAEAFNKRTPLDVFDAGGNLHFKIFKGDSLLMYTDRLFLDAAGCPIVLLRRKTFSFDDVWRVYRGKHGKKEAALFKVMRKKDGLGLDVVMATSMDKNSEKEMMGEFSVGGRVLPTFYLNQSVIATVRKMSDREVGGLEVMVNQEIDCALILALLVIHGEMGHWRMDKPEYYKLFRGVTPPRRPPSRLVQTAVVHSGRSRKNEGRATAGFSGANAGYVSGFGGYGGGGGGGGGTYGGWGGCSLF